MRRDVWTFIMQLDSAKQDSQSRRPGEGRSDVYIVFGSHFRGEQGPENMRSHTKRCQSLNV